MFSSLQNRTSGLDLVKQAQQDYALGIMDQGTATKGLLWPMGGFDACTAHFDGCDRPRIDHA